MIQAVDGKDVAASAPRDVGWWAERTAAASVVVGGFVAPFSLALQETTLVIAIIAWAIAKCRRPSALPTRLIGPFLCWLLASVLSMVNTVDVTASLKGLLKVVKATALVFVVSDVMRTKRRQSMLLTAVWAGAAFTALDGLLQIFFGVELVYHRLAGTAPGGYPRVTAMFNHPNDFSVYAVTVLPMCLAMASGVVLRIGRGWLWLVVGLLSFCMPWTFSRAAGLAVVASVLAFCLVRRLWWLLGVCGLLGAGFLIWLPESVKQFAVSQGSLWNMLVLPERPDHWYAAIQMIKAHPIVGVGVNTFVLNYSRYKAPTNAILSAYAHNQYLHLTAEIGLLGLAAFGWLLGLTLVAWRNLSRDRDPWVRLTGAGLGCGLVGFLTIGMLESALYSAKTNFVFWVWMGLLHGLARRTERSIEHTRSDSERIAR